MTSAPHGLRGLHRQQPDRAAAQHRHALARLHPRAAHGVEGDGRGLDEGGLLAGDGLRQADGLVGAPQHVLGQPPSSANPATAMFGHIVSSPAAQRRQSRQVSTVLRATLSPGPTFETPSPASTTVPVISCPVTSGSVRPVTGLGEPWAMKLGPYRYSSMSVAQMPQWSMRSFTSPGPGWGPGCLRA